MPECGKLSAFVLLNIAPSQHAYYYPLGLKSHRANGSEEALWRPLLFIGHCLVFNFSSPRLLPRCA
jgi:hypothetical protein